MTDLKLDGQGTGVVGSEASVGFRTLSPPARPINADLLDEIVELHTKTQRRVRLGAFASWGVGVLAMGPLADLIGSGGILVVIFAFWATTGGIGLFGAKLLASWRVKQLCKSAGLGVDDTRQVVNAVKSYRVQMGGESKEDFQKGFLDHVMSSVWGSASVPPGEDDDGGRDLAAARERQGLRGPVDAPDEDAKHSAVEREITRRYE